MTSRSPRIYLYKISFEEVSYYYYGVHKERVFDEEYWGTPITHKWVWDFYTSKKQILQLFDFTDEGWLEANNIERRIIKPFLNDKLCLNEGCGGVFSFETSSKAGKIGGKKTYELRIGLHSLTTEERREIGKKVGKKTYELGIGAFGISKEKRKETSKKANETNKKNNTGIYSRTEEEMIESGKNWGKKGSKKTNSQKWMCLETGFITTSGPLTTYQRARGIDTTKRKQIS